MFAVIVFCTKSNFGFTLQSSKVIIELYKIDTCFISSQFTIYLLCVQNYLCLYTNLKLLLY